MKNLEEIEHLFELKKKGIITEVEFEEQKAKLLQEPPSSTNTSLIQAYKDFWKKTFVWRGRATQGEYWWPFLFNMVINSVLGSRYFSGNGYNFLISIVFSIILIFPSLSVSVRRFHDLGKSALFALFPFWIILGGVAIAFFDTLMSYLGIDLGLRNLRTLFYILLGCSLFASWIIWLVFLALPGQKFPNKYGDPK